MRRMCTIALALWGCGDDSATTGGNTHLPGSDAILDAPALADGPPIDAMDDAAPALTCGPGGPEVLPLPPSGQVAGAAAIGASLFAGSCGGGSGAEVIYHVPITIPLQSLTFSTKLLQTTYRPILYVRTACDQASSEVGCQASTASAKASVTLANPAMTDYFVFVDSPNAAQSGIYALSVKGNIADGAACDAGNSMFVCRARHICVARTPGGGTHCEAAQCGDGVDNDGDGLIDFPHDPGCTSLEDDDETDDCGTSGMAGPNCPQCGNRIDDDGDGLIDYPMDPGCSSRADTDESNDCVPAPGMPSVPVTDITGMNNITVNGSTGGTGVFDSTACGASAAGPEKVYRLRLSQAISSLRVTTCSSMTNFDTVLYIRKQTCFNSANPTNQIASNDDYGSQCGGLPAPPANGICNGVDGLQSYIKTGALQPGIYYIFVDSYDGSSGNFHLTVNITP